MTRCDAVTSLNSLFIVTKYSTRRHLVGQGVFGMCVK